MERKFKVGDRVRAGFLKEGNVVLVSNEDKTYLVDFNKNGTDWGWFNASQLTLIPSKKLPEPKYKSGDKVWNKDTKSIWEFVCYQENNEVSIKKSNTFIFLTTLESDIEPYTGQYKQESDKIYKDFEEKMKAMDKQFRDALFKAEQDALREFCAPNPHPYTVILKSGVKVGVSQGIAIAMIACMDSESCKRINNSEYFLHSEIAAIVPTENIK